MSAFTIYTAAEAAVAAKTSRQTIDIACHNGALRAVDEAAERNRLAGKESSRKAWRILEADLIDWHHRGRPLTPERAA